MTTERNITDWVTNDFGITDGCKVQIIKLVEDYNLQSNEEFHALLNFVIEEHSMDRDRTVFNDFMDSWKALNRQGA